MQCLKAAAHLNLQQVLVSGAVPLVQAIPSQQSLQRSAWCRQSIFCCQAIIYKNGDTTI